MSKKIKYIPFLCLLICLTFAGCAGKGGDVNGESSTEDNRISVPTDAATEEQTTDTTEAATEKITEEDTTRPDYPSDIIIDPVPVVPPFDDTESTLPPETDSDDSQPEDTEPIDVPDIKFESIELGDAFLAGDPAAGTLVSQQNEKIRLVVNYNIQMNIDGSISADFLVGLESYDINCGARVNAGKLVVNGTEIKFSTDAIVHEEREMIFIPFTEYTYQLNPGETSLDIEASWLFNGSYAGTFIDTLALNASFVWDAPSADTVAE